jgi:hypothetical protein
MIGIVTVCVETEMLPIRDHQQRVLRHLDTETMGLKTNIIGDRQYKWQALTYLIIGMPTPTVWLIGVLRLSMKLFVNVETNEVMDLDPDRKLLWVDILWVLIRSGTEMKLWKLWVQLQYMHLYPSELYSINEKKKKNLRQGYSWAQLYA